MSPAIFSLYLINIFCSGITAGGLVLVMMALVPMQHKMSLETSVEVHQKFDILPDRYMRPSTAISGLTAILVLILRRDVSSTSAIFTLVGLGGTIGVILVSELINVRINRTIHGWSTHEVPEEYLRLRRRWEIFHVVRTACGLLAFSHYIVSVLVL